MPLTVISCRKTDTGHAYYYSSAEALLNLGTVQFYAWDQKVSLVDVVQQFIY